MRPVYVTGVGVLCGAGVGREAFVAAQARGEVPQQLEEWGGPFGSPRRIRVCRIPPFDAREYVGAGRARRMAEGSKPGVVAAVLSEQDALAWGGDSSVPPERRSVVLGTGLGPIGTTGEILDLLAREGPAGAEPFLFIESLHNSAAGHASIVLECRGPTITPVAGDASGLMAVIEGANLIRDGRVDRVYAGGMEEASPFHMSLLARILQPEREIPLLGAGAACFRLDAVPGNARPYAQILASASSQDPTAPEGDYSRDPAVPRRVLERVLQRAGWEGDGVDLLVTADNGFPSLRALEEKAYTRWPDRSGNGRCRRASPARIFGAFAGSGSLAVATAVLALAEEGRQRSRAIVCLPSWGGSCQALALSSIRD